MCVGLELAWFALERTVYLEAQETGRTKEGLEVMGKKEWRGCLGSFHFHLDGRPENGRMLARSSLWIRFGARLAPLVTLVWHLWSSWRF